MLYNWWFSPCLNKVYVCMYVCMITLLLWWSTIDRQKIYFHFIYTLSHNLNQEIFTIRSEASFQIFALNIKSFYDNWQKRKFPCQLCGVLGSAERFLRRILNLILWTLEILFTRASVTFCFVLFSRCILFLCHEKHKETPKASFQGLRFANIFKNWLDFYWGPVVTWLAFV